MCPWRKWGRHERSRRTVSWASALARSRLCDDSLSSFSSKCCQLNISIDLIRTPGLGLMGCVITQQDKPNHYWLWPLTVQPHGLVRNPIMHGCCITERLLMSWSKENLPLTKQDETVLGQDELQTETRAQLQITEAVTETGPPVPQLWWRKPQLRDAACGPESVSHCSTHLLLLLLHIYTLRKTKAHDVFHIRSVQLYYRQNIILNKFSYSSKPWCFC